MQSNADKGGTFWGRFIERSAQGEKKGRDFLQTERAIKKQKLTGDCTGGKRKKKIEHMEMLGEQGSGVGGNEK